MKKVVFKILLACTLVFGVSSLQSCKSSSVLKTSSQSFAKTNPEEIEVFPSRTPTQKYIEIGTVSSSKHFIGFSKSDNKIYKKLKEKAASIGGHAIINLSEDMMDVKGVVIRYTK